MWRTNFDTKSYQDVQQQCGRRSSPDPHPHLADIQPRGPRLNYTQPTDVQVDPVLHDFTCKFNFSKSVRAGITGVNGDIIDQIKPTPLNRQEEELILDLAVT